MYGHGDLLMSYRQLKTLSPMQYGMMLQSRRKKRRLNKQPFQTNWLHFFFKPTHQRLSLNTVYAPATTGCRVQIEYKTSQIRSTTMKNILKEIGDLQNNYQKLIDNNQLTKKAICDLVIPFRDEYNLSDSQALQIARAELSIFEINNLLKLDDDTDVCEWTEYDYKTIQSPHDRHWSIPSMKDFIYCPYCGKKIRIIK